jgi:hypothetical protein
VVEVGEVSRTTRSQRSLAGRLLPGSVLILGGLYVVVCLVTLGTPRVLVARKRTAAAYRAVAYGGPYG